MEVKQNTAVDLNDLLAPVKNSDGADEVDDVVMTDLTEESHDLNCDIMKANGKKSTSFLSYYHLYLIKSFFYFFLEKSNNGLVTNGDETLSSLIDLDSTNVALDTSVNAELEDALLAEDDVLPKLDDVKENNITASTSDVVEDILADKVETSNSTTSSNNVRDPGDDLDTLLSKINDIVEDCLDKEITDPTAEDDSVVEQPEEDGVVEQPEEDSVVEQPGEDNVAEQPEVEDNANIPVAASVATTDPKDESVILLDDTVAESSCLENDIADESDVHKVDESNEIPLPEEEEETDIEGDKDKIDERDVATPDLDKFPEDFITTESEKMSKTVPDTTTLTEKVSVENPATDTDTPLEDVLPEKDTTDGDTISPVDADTDIKEKTEEDSEEQKITQIEEENNVLEDDKMDDSPKLDDEKNNEDELLDENSTNKDDKPGSTSEDDAQLLKKESASLDIEEETKESEQLSKGDEQLTKEDEHKVEKLESTSEKSTSENDQIKDSTETKSVPDDVQNRTNEQTEKVEHEDSDDEIVFYVDKPPGTEKDKKSTVDENEMSTASSSKAVDEKSQEVNEEKPSAEEDDVVILDDDDEMQGNKKLADSSHTEDTPSVEKTSAEEKDNEKSSSAEKTAEEAAAKEDRKHSTIDIDNSDNARDDFVVSEKASDETKKSHEPEESNSNCSSSSNLLLEAKQVENAADEPTPEDNDNENEEEDDDGDVELIETESKEADLSEKGDDGSEIVPPAKRPRLSEDSEISSKTDETSKSRRTSESAEKKSEVAEDVSTTPASTATSLKRTHDVIELEIDDDKSNDSKSSLSTETVNKKAKTEELSSKEDDIKAQTETDEEKFIKSDIDSKTETNKDIVKMVPSEIPIPLYPPPKLKNLSPEESISLGFMKKFRKTFDKMTKQDLEELVLQKVVEAIIHRSEFAEMRELIEKQEKLITSHRSKISELSKQFRDLEMVHNRVVKDIEQRNSQFIMPVKITRAVGLQVYIPNKKSVLESTAPASGNINAMPTVSPQRSATSSVQSNLTSPQRQYHSTQTSATDVPVRVTGGNTSSPNTGNSSSITTSSLQRRGCAQKVTPIRPVPTGNVISASAPTGNTVPNQIYRSNLNQQNQIPPQPRILNKNAASATAGSGGPSNTTNASPMQRQRFVQPSSDTPQRMPQQHSQQQQQGSRSAGTVMNK